MKFLVKHPQKFRDQLFLRPHLTYKTIKIHNHTTSRQIISSLLARFRMRHMDYKLYYLTMEVYVNNALQTITLDDNSRPAELISCNPWHVECKFILKSKTGGRVKIYDDQIRPDSVYKSIIISRETTVGDSLAILHNCYPHPMLDSQARDWNRIFWIKPLIQLGLRNIFSITTYILDIFVIDFLLKFC